MAVSNFSPAVRCSSLEDMEDEYIDPHSLSGLVARPSAQECQLTRVPSSLVPHVLAVRWRRGGTADYFDLAVERLEEYLESGTSWCLGLTVLLRLAALPAVARPRPRARPVGRAR